MLGMYAPVLGAVNDREVVELAVFAVGATAGLSLFSTLLSWMLGRHGDKVMAALIGLMIGSVRVLWPWPDGVGVISDDETEVVDGTGIDLPDGLADFAWPTLLAVVAFIVVLGLSLVAERRTGPSRSRQPSPSRSL